MNVSAIIPTYNGAQKIIHILRALENQTSQPDEVIVVIDGSTDNTEAIIKQNKFSFKVLRVFNQPNGGRAKVRNSGAKSAIGDLLIFFDDDMRPTSDCIKVHMDHHNKYPGSILTGSQIEEVLPDSSEIFRFKGHLSQKWNLRFDHTELAPLTSEQIFITAANFSIAKSTFQLLGGFDERLTDAEDFDLAVRAYSIQVPLYVNLKAHAWHDDKITCCSYVKRLRQYQEAHMRLKELKPELYNSNKHLPSLPRGIKKGVFLFFAKKIWIKLIDQNFIFKLIPKNLRYKLYDIVITANGVYFPQKVKL